MGTSAVALAFLCGFLADAVYVAWLSCAERDRPLPVAAAVCSMLWLGVTFVAAREAIVAPAALVSAALGHGAGTYVSVLLRARTRRTERSLSAVDDVRARAVVATNLWNAHVALGRLPTREEALAISTVCGLTTPISTAERRPRLLRWWRSP